MSRQFMQPSVVVYRTRFCPYCTLVARLLNHEQVAFTEIDVSGDAAQRAWLIRETGQRTVPQIFVNGRSIGGFREIAALARRGALHDVLREASVLKPGP